MDPENFEYGSTAAPLDQRSRSAGLPKYVPLLVCFEGPQRGQTFPIRNVETRVGRHQEVEVRLTDESASRYHARILYRNWLNSAEPPECYLEDLNSRNGTELNGRAVDERAQLKERDRIRIGSTVLGYVVKDETEIQLEKSIFELATRDALTGLENRRQFQAQLAHYVEHARRSHRSVGLLVIDADRFKRVNDTYGHDVGDKVLAHLAWVIKGCCRAQEICGRWGGEEFVVLLPDSDMTGTQAAGERIRETVELTPLDIGQPEPLFMTVSIGGASIQRDEGQESLFHRADQQTLRAKQDGRNRVYVDGLDIPSDPTTSAG
jgi:two-component system cell cycle response regulator